VSAGQCGHHDWAVFSVSRRAAMATVRVDIGCGVCGTLWEEVRRGGKERKCGDHPIYYIFYSISFFFYEVGYQVFAW
jgi:hypothetical protein